MNNTQLEEFVTMALAAFDASGMQYQRNEFELELRRVLMKRYCSNTQNVNNTMTYTVTPGTLYGTWSGVHLDTKQMLHG